MSCKTLVALSSAALSATLALANVNLELRPAQARYQPGQIVEVGLYAVSDSDAPQAIRGMQIILNWDPEYLLLDAAQPNVNNGPYPWLMSGFFPDGAADGLNDTWADGNAYYQAIGNFTSLAYATPAGLLVTTLRFHALEYVSYTELNMPPAFGLYTQTEVYGVNVGETVTGLLIPAHIDIAPPPQWGRLALAFEEPLCGFEFGETFTINLLVTELSEPINGVQVLVTYPTGVVAFLGALPGDGQGSPWDAATEVAEYAEDGVVTYALVLSGGSSSADAVVAKLSFQYQPPAIPAAFELRISPVEMWLFTRLTKGSTGVAVIPNLDPEIRASSSGDFDFDGVSDLVEFAATALCLEGPDQATCCPECCRLDLDGDSDVDLRDFAGLQLMFDPAP